ncbi:MAG: hypothetical protein M3Y09_01975 [Actinomycetota bacterium]|nr:hypothetical protein [Actinomycetota bacterium]
MLLFRAVVRLVGLLWMLVLALLGLGVAVYCIDGFISLGSARPDRLLGLTAVRHHVGRFLNQVGLPGPTAALGLLCGLAAILIGLLLLLGTLRSRKERLVVFERDVSGTLAAKPRTLRAMARALAEQAPGATSITRPRLTLSRRGNRGRLKVTASRARTSDPQAVQDAINARLEPISDPFALKLRIRVRLGERVQ